MRALVLSGGGAAGAYQAGAVTALVRRVSYDIVCGASIGAINGAVVAQNKIEELDRIWHTIASKRVIRYVPQVQRLLRFISGVESLNRDPLFMRPGDLLRLVTRYLELGPPSDIYRQMGTVMREPVMEALAYAMDFHALERTFIVSATNVTLSRSDCFYAFAGAHRGFERSFRSKRRGTSFPLTPENFFPAILASSAAPGAFEPLEIDVGEACYQYVDGGIANNTPIGMAIDAGASDVTVVGVEPFEDEATPRPPSTMAELAQVSYNVFQDRVLKLDLKLAETVNKAILGDALKGKRVVSLHAVYPARRLGLPVLGFDDQAAIDAAFEQGLRDGEIADVT